MSFTRILRPLAALLALTITSGAQSTDLPATPPRFDYIFAGSMPSSLKIDQANQLLYASFSQLNRVDKISLLTLQVLASVDVFEPGPMDLSADGSSLFVKSWRVPVLFKVRLSDFKLSNNYFLPPAFDDPDGTLKLCATSDDRIFLLSYSSAASAVFDIQTQSFSPLNSFAPGLLYGPVGMACSGDHSRVVFLQGFSPSYLALYDSASHGFSAFHRVDGSEWAPLLHMNHTGDRILFSKTILFDENLAELARLPDQPQTFYFNGAAFSPDGNELILWQPLPGRTNDQWTQSMRVVNARTGRWKRDTAFRYFEQVNNMPSFRKDIAVSDDLGRLFAPRQSGIGVLDSTQFWNGILGPMVYGTSPRVGSSSSNTSFTAYRQYGEYSVPSIWVGDVVLQGVTHGPLAQLDIGNGTPTTAQPITGTLAPLSLGRSTSPVQLLFGGASVIAQGFSATCSIQRVSPTAVLPGRQFTVWGFGFSTTPGQNQLTVGGLPATVEEPAPTAFPTVSYGLMSIQAVMPTGTAAGPLDLSLSAAGNTCSRSRALTAFTSETLIPLPAFSQMIFDAPRHRLYVSSPAEGLVRVINSDTLQPGSSFTVGQGAGSMAMLPDGSRLAVSNYLGTNSSSISVIDLQTGAVSSAVPTPAQFTPWRLAPSLHGTFFAGNTEFNPANNSFVVKMDTASNVAVGNVYASSSNGKWVLFGGTGAAYFYDAEADRGVFNSRHANMTGSPAISNDGATLIVNDKIVDANLSPVLGGCRPLAPVIGTDSTTYFFNAPHFNDSGSLLYYPTNWGLYVCGAVHGNVLFDVNLANPDPASFNGNMAVDNTGRKVFLRAKNGIAVLELNHLPLAIGHIKPFYSVSGADTPIVIRGSGFKPGITAKLDEVSFAVTFVDESTLQATLAPTVLGPHSLTLTNPDGEIFSHPAAFTVIETEPLITAIDPEYLNVNYGGDLPMVVSGAGFTPNAVVRFNGNPIATRYGGPGLLYATIPAAALGNTFPIPTPPPTVSTVNVLDSVTLVTSNSKNFYAHSPDVGLQVTPGSLIFSPQITGILPLDANYQALSMQNTTYSSGYPPTGITVSGLSFTGPFYALDNACNVYLSWLQRCITRIGFRPTTLGPASGTLLVLGSSSQTLATVPLAGTGADLFLSVSRPSRPRRSSSTSTAQTQTFQLHLGASEPGVEATLNLQCLTTADWLCHLDANQYRLKATASPVRVTIRPRRSRRLSKSQPDSFAVVKARAGDYERSIRIPLQ